MKHYWQICAKGHSMFHLPDEPYNVCKMCNRAIVMSGVINENIQWDEYSDKQWAEYSLTLQRIGQDWIDAHGDDGEILNWTEGEIITHRDCGGLGVVCSSPGGRYEPPRTYVRWVVIPDWEMPTQEANPESVWLGDRNNSFKKAVAIHHNCVVT